MEYQPWTSCERAKLHKLRSLGKKPHEIAVILNRTESTIHRILSLDKKNGIIHSKLRNGNLKYDKARVEKWRNMWKEGMTQRAIAKSENVNHVIVSIKLRQELYGELVH